MNDHASQWGRSFRLAWRQATPLAQEAARKAAASPEQAARSLSDAIGHALQLAIYAAEDWHRLQEQHAQGAQKQQAAAFPGPIRRAMDEFRKGRMTPEQSERHLRQAAQEAASDMERQASMHLPAGEDTAMHVARERFGSARQRLAGQMAETQRKLNAAAPAAGTQDGGAEAQNQVRDQVSNHRLAMQLDATLSRIDELFLPNKAAHDPVAPLPDASDGRQEDTPCPMPRA